MGARRALINVEGQPNLSNLVITVPRTFYRECLLNDYTVGAVIRVAAKIKVAALLTSILQYLKIKIRFFSFCNVNLSMLRTIIIKKAEIFSSLYT